MKRILQSTILLLITTSALHAQTSVQLNINHLLGENTFSTSATGTNNFDNEFNVGRLQYYISQISIIHDGGSETECEDLYLFVDANEEGQFMLGEYEVSEIEGIKFYIGVNTPENNDDPSQWPEGHALAPRFPSMHWGWAAGYRFVAFEGKSGESFSQTYEIHALGNQNYFACQLPVQATDENGALVIDLNADYAKALTNINVSSGVITHGDYNEAITLLENFVNEVFTNQDGQTNVLSAQEYELNKSFSVYPNPSNGLVNFQLIDVLNTNLYLNITDLSGREILKSSLTQSTTTLSLQKGLYMARIEGENGVLALKRIVIQ